MDRNINIMIMCQYYVRAITDDGPCVLLLMILNCNHFHACRCAREASVQWSEHVEQLSHKFQSIFRACIKLH